MTRKIWRVAKIFLVIFAIAIVVYQTVINTQNTRLSRKSKEDLLGNHPSCTIPCWNQITPGLTKSDEALQLLQQIEYVNVDTLHQFGTAENGECLWYWKMPGKGFPTEMRWEKGIVRAIGINLTYSLTIEEVIDQFGFPENVGVMQDGNPEIWYWTFDLFYPGLGLQFRGSTDQLSATASPTTEISGVFLYSPTSIENYMEEFYPGISPDSNWKITQWKGYGNLKELYGAENIY